MSTVPSAFFGLFETLGAKFFFAKQTNHLNAEFFKLLKVLLHLTEMRHPDLSLVVVNASEQDAFPAVRREQKRLIVDVRSQMLLGRITDLQCLGRFFGRLVCDQMADGDHQKGTGRYRLGYELGHFLSPTMS
jgi:hypothetical protein